MKKIITKSITIITMLVLMFTLAMPMTVQAKAKPKLNKTKVTLTITKKKTKPTVQLKVKNASKKVKWKISNKNVATVSEKGKVTAKSKGIAFITAKTGSQTLRCKVTVKDTRKDKTPSNKCKHKFEEHWTVFEESYEEPDSPMYFCYCKLFTSEDEYKQHIFEIATRIGISEPSKEERMCGLHGTKAKQFIDSYSVGNKNYVTLTTKYIESMTCTKCGKKITVWW